MANEFYNPHLRTKKTTQEIMRDVCIALIPALIASIVFFGFRSLLLVCVSAVTCMAAEALWQAAHKEAVTVSDFSAVVTGILLAFNVSSTTPVWVLMIADVFAIIVVKQFFGGLGSNVVNPALMGRLFLMLVYPASMMSYVMPQNVDAVSSATILSAVKHGGEAGFTVLDAFLGKVPGALGETSALCLLIGFAYLVYKKEVNWMISAAFFATVFVIMAVCGQGPFLQLFSGGLILGGCFMLTDYNLASKKGNLLYGIAAGIIVAAVRLWGTYPEGVCYAILFVNIMSVIIDKISTRHVYGISQEGK